MAPWWDFNGQAPLLQTLCKFVYNIRVITVMCAIWLPTNRCFGVGCCASIPVLESRCANVLGPSFIIPAARCARHCWRGGWSLRAFLSELLGLPWGPFGPDNSNERLGADAGGAPQTKGAQNALRRARQPWNRWRPTPANRPRESLGTPVGSTGAHVGTHGATNTQTTN